MVELTKKLNDMVNAGVAIFWFCICLFGGAAVIVWMVSSYSDLMNFLLLPVFVLWFSVFLYGRVLLRKAHSFLFSPESVFNGHYAYATNTISMVMPSFFVATVACHGFIMVRMTEEGSVPKETVAQSVLVNKSTLESLGVSGFQYNFVEEYA